VKATTIGIRTLADYSIWLMDCQHHLQLWKLIPENFVARWGPSGKHQAVGRVGPHDRPVLPPAVPPAGADARM
jgi:hypothetical protein